MAELFSYNAEDIDMKFALVDIRIKDEFADSLTAFGYEVIKLPPYSNLPSPLASHPDMLLHLSGKNLITNADYYGENRDIFDRLEKEADINLIVSDELPTATYPSDAKYNALYLSGKVILRKKSVAREILSLADRCGLTIINTNQGYPACTTLPLSPTHIISADMGIIKVARKNGIDATPIENGDILLPPYEYGFIGGSSGVDGDTVFFLGDIKTHRSYDIIKGVTEELGLKIVSLGVGPLFDLGGIIFIPKGCEDNGDKGH